MCFEEHCEARLLPMDEIEPSCVRSNGHLGIEDEVKTNEEIHVSLSKHASAHRLIHLSGKFRTSTGATTVL